MWAMRMLTYSSKHSRPFPVLLFYNIQERPIRSNVICLESWAIAFQKGTVQYIYFIAETKGSMESMDLRPIEQAKIKCAKKLFNEISTDDVVYDQVDSYQNLLHPEHLPICVFCSGMSATFR